MQKKTVFGVRASLVVLVLGCVLPMAAIAAFLLVDFYARERRQLIEHSANRARTIMAAIDLDFDRTQAALQALATSQKLANGDLQGFRQRAVNAVPFTGADSIVVIDRSGALLMSTRRPFGTKLPQLTSTPLLERIVATGKPGVSDLFHGPIAGQLIYTIGVPVAANGAVAMTVNAIATPDTLNALLGQQQFDRGWRAAILDGSGRIVARTHDVGKYLGQQTTDALRDRLAAGGEGRFDSHTLDGIEVLTFYCKSPHSGWAVTMGIPRDQLTAGLRHSLAWLIGATLAALAVGLGLAWAIGGAIAGSVRALIAPALGVGTGSLTPIGPLPIKECDELRLVLEDAAHQLGKARDRRQKDELDLLARQKEVTLLGRIAMLGELSGALAHELNQPLTAILSNAQAGLRFLAQQPPDLDEVGDILRDIVAEDQRAGQVIVRLRSLFDRKETPHQRIDLNRLAGAVLDLLRNDLINHGATVRTRFAPAAVMVDADSVQLQQVLINLLMNACDAMSAQQERERFVTISTTVDDGGTACLSIQDNGPGIAPDMGETIFTPFFTTKAGGMGLGLSICRSILLAHQGRLWAENGRGGGAIFHLSLPVASA